MTTAAVKFIMAHAAVPYDPVKAHDYYIKNRKLKGRMLGIGAAPGGGRLRKLNDITDEITDTIVVNGKKIHDPSVPLPGAPKITLTEQRQAQVQQRVKALKGKLTILNAILNQLVKNAQGSSAPSTTKKPSPTTGTNKATAANTNRKPLTGAEKADAAKKQRDRYQKAHPDAGKDKENAKKIKEVKAKIKEVQSDLKAAIASSRKKATQTQPAAPSRRKS